MGKIWPIVQSYSCPQVSSCSVSLGMQGDWGEYWPGNQESWAVGSALPLCVHLSLDKF